VSHLFSDNNYVRLETVGHAVSLYGNSVSVGIVGHRLSDYSNFVSVGFVGHTVSEIVLLSLRELWVTQCLIIV
jgi:hypothetical protein